MKFTEAQLEQAIIELLGEQGYPYVPGADIARGPEEVLVKDDLRAYLQARYASNGITDGEIDFIVNKVERLPTSDLYGSNRAFMKLVSDGFLLKREDRSQKDLFIHLIDYSPADRNVYKVVNQLEIEGFEKLIPLAKAVKDVVDDKTKYTGWDNREDIKAELKVDLIMLMAEYGYPPITHDDVYREIFEQAQNVNYSPVNERDCASILFKREDIEDWISKQKKRVG